MTIFGFPIDEEFGFVLTCGKLDPIEFHCATPDEGYKRAKDRQLDEKSKNRRNYTLTYRLITEVKEEA